MSEERVRVPPGGPRQKESNPGDGRAVVLAHPGRCRTRIRRVGCAVSAPTRGVLGSTPRWSAFDGEVTVAPLAVYQRVRVRIPSVELRIAVRSSNGKAPGLHPEDGGSIPSRTTWTDSGRDTALIRRLVVGSTPAGPTRSRSQLVTMLGCLPRGAGSIPAGTAWHGRLGCAQDKPPRASGALVT